MVDNASKTPISTHPHFPQAWQFYFQNTPCLKSLSHISGELFQEPPILYFRKRDEKIFPVSMNLKSYVLKNRKGHFLDAYAEYVLRIDSVALKKNKSKCFIA